MNSSGLSSLVKPMNLMNVGIGLGKPPVSQALLTTASSFLMNNNTTNPTHNKPTLHHHHPTSPLKLPHHQQQQQILNSENIQQQNNQHMIFIDEGTIIHPRCILECGNNSKGIKIGKNNVIEEGVAIINLGTDTLIIGSNNHIKAGVYISGHVKLGDYNVLECKCRIENVQIDDYCIVNPMCELISSSSSTMGGEQESSTNTGLSGGRYHLPSFTLVLGLNSTRKSLLSQKDKIKSIQEKQIQQQLLTLRNLLPNYHKTFNY